MPFVKLTPGKWPQDDQVVPRGLGAMPPVEFGNKAVVGAEYFALSADFVFPHTLNFLQTQRQVLPTPQDGDFWVDQISIISWGTFVGQTIRQVAAYMDGMVQFSDIRTGTTPIFSPLYNTPPNQGYLIPQNSLPMALFRKYQRSGVEGDLLYNGNIPLPSGFRDTGTLIQPMLFTRQGGIAVSMTNNVNPPGGSGSPVDYTITICFSGWKEYANASG